MTLKYNIVLILFIIIIIIGSKGFFYRSACY